jgi:hypothetical protein
MMDAERKAEIRTRCDPSQRQPCRAYLEDVPDLLAAIDELEVRNAKLEAVAKVCREHVHGGSIVDVVMALALAACT